MHRTKLTRALAPLFAALLLAGPAAAEEKAKVAATLPYLGDVVRAVGGDLVEVEVLAPPGQDPHWIVPTPARAVVVRNADAYVETGLQLEIWSERVIDLARNQQLRPGYPNHLFAFNGIKPLQVPVNQTRAGGDIHPGGNPHIWLSPINLKVVAKNVEALLTNVRPAHAKTFQANRKAYVAKLDAAYYGADLVKVMGVRLLDRLQNSGRLFGFLREKQYKGKPLSDLAGGWLKRALDLDGLTFVAYHQTWVYFVAAFGFQVVATIEEKPGIPPSPSHLDFIQEMAAANETNVVVAAPFYPFSRAEGVAERIGGNAVVLPTEPGEEGTSDLFDMYDTIFDRLEQAAATSNQGGPSDEGAAEQGGATDDGGDD
jgi:ABC-type Zn uptake system ZnuABC Zn-binding protein ZnuA